MAIIDLLAYTKTHCNLIYLGSVYLEKKIKMPINFAGKWNYKTVLSVVPIVLNNQSDVSITVNKNRS